MRKKIIETDKKLFINVNKEKKSKYTTKIEKFKRATEREEDRRRKKKERQNEQNFIVYVKYLQKTNTLYFKV